MRAAGSAYKQRPLPASSWRALDECKQQQQPERRQHHSRRLQAIPDAPVMPAIAMTHAVQPDVPLSLWRAPDRNGENTSVCRCLTTKLKVQVERASAEFSPASAFPWYLILLACYFAGIMSGLRNSEPSMTSTHQKDKILVELTSNAEMRRDWQAQQVSLALCV